LVKRGLRPRAPAVRHCGPRFAAVLGRPPRTRRSPGRPV